MANVSMQWNYTRNEFAHFPARTICKRLYCLVGPQQGPQLTSKLWSLLCRLPPPYGGECSLLVPAITMARQSLQNATGHHHNMEVVFYCKFSHQLCSRRHNLNRCDDTQAKIKQKMKALILTDH